LLTSEVEEVVVLKTVNGLELTTDIKLLGGVEEVLDTGVSVIIAAKDLLGLVDLVRSVNILNGQDGKVSVVTEIAEGDASAGLDTKLVDLGLANIEVDGHGEESAIGKTVVLNNAIVVLLIQEAFEGRETTVKDKLKIAKVSLAECEGRKLLSLGLELGLARQVTGEEVLEDTTMRSVGHYAVRVCGVFGRVFKKLKLQEPSRVESLGVVLTKQKPKSEHAIGGVND
jgi:Fe2+ transport system protein FeoA